jgi:hypothetical protein
MSYHLTSGTQIFGSAPHWDIPKPYPDGFVVTTETHPPETPFPEMMRPIHRVTHWYETFPEVLAGELSSPAIRLLKLSSSEDGWHVIDWTDGRRSYTTYVTDCTPSLTTDH